MAIALRWAGRAGLLALGVFVVLALWIGAGVMASKPQLAGARAAVGLGAQAYIIRDKQGVPHIFGASDHDIYFALGYAHAQDRFFQMDLTRRSVEGRLAEIVGTLALRLDARARTKGFNKVIEAQTDSLSPAARAMLEAYAAGVNARLAQGAPSAEYAILFVKPAPWRVEDSVAVGVALTNDLVVGDAQDYARVELAKRLTPAQIEQFFPPYPKEAPRSDGARTADAPAPGSNAWVVGGGRTRTGKPILASDPHLGFSAPGPFYLARLALSDGDQVGFTVAGAPLIVMGRNQHLAWGVTNNEIDSSDLIIAPEGGFADVTTRSEAITVRDWFGFHHDKTIEVSATPDGPLLAPDWFDLKPFNDKPVMLRSAALDPTNRIIDALFAMGRAQNADEFIAATKPWTAPLVHIIAASTDGEIALISAGRMPMRDARGAWIGEIPQAAQPIVKNPPAQILATANNLALPKEFPYPVQGAFSADRIARITEQLDRGGGEDASNAAALQNDVASSFAVSAAGLLAAAKPQSAAGKAAQEKLLAWDHRMAADRAEPLIFAVWIEALSRAIYSDDLGDELYADYAGPRQSFLKTVFAGDASAWCDDVKTQNAETCVDLAAPALDAAAKVLVRRYGADPARWRWGAAHKARFAHPLFSGAPLLGDWLDVIAPVGGDSGTINAEGYVHGYGFTAIHGPSVRAIYDLADLNKSKFVVAPGQSGHPLSPYYRNLISAWAKGEYFEVRSDWKADAPPAGAQTLTLKPR